MAKILSDVRTATRAILDETTAADWSNAELNTLINQRYHRVYTTVINVYEDYYLTTDTFNSVADQQEYSSAHGVNSDIYKIRRVELNFNVSNANSAPTRCMPIKDTDAVLRDLGQQNIGVQIFSHAYYYTFGHGSSFTIGFIPIPDRTGTNAIRMWYITQISDMSSDSTNLNIPYADRYFYIIAEGAAADALRFGQQDSAEADKLDIKFDKGLLLMQQELEDYTAEGTRHVLDISGEYIDFEQTSY